VTGSEELVFDTGPLRHFAQQQWLVVLRFITANRRVVIPESVEEELKLQAGSDSRLVPLLDCDWITVHRTGDLSFVAAFANYARQLVDREGHNRGECGVLALGHVHGWEMVLDDSTPRSIAESENLDVTATVPLLCRAIAEKQLTVPMVEALADDLLANSYYLPFGPGGFRRHVLENGLLDYDDVS